jgi:hypothetical protein
VSLFPWLLFVHILGAIVAFGPTFAFPLIGGMGAKEPMHGNFALRVSERIERGVVIPLAIVQGVTGLGLVITLGLDLTKEHWLDVAIVLYLTALGFAIFVQTKRIERMIHLTSGPPPAAVAAMSAAPAAMVGVDATVPALASIGASTNDGGSAASGVAVANPPVTTAGPPARPSGPPPEVAAAAAAIQQGGMFLTVLIVAIVSLMVLRPTF